MDEEKPKEISADKHPIILRNLIKEAQSTWEAMSNDVTRLAVGHMKIEILPEYFKAFEEVLKKEGTEIAGKQLAVLNQLKSDQDKLNELPKEPFEETLKKLKELEK